MKARDFLPWLRDTTLRLLPHATRPRLIRIGDPGLDSVVLLTGNFTLTVRRLLDTLAGRDAWLLVCNSKGINVWCAAGGGHLTHHDVIAAIRSSGIGDLVQHRELILPQLAATGVEPQKIEAATGWSTKWGPARMEDLPEFLDAGCHSKKRQRLMRFPTWERLEMSLMWALPMALVGGLALTLLRRWPVGAVAGGVTLLTVLSIFLLLPKLRVTGRLRWLTYAGFAVASGAIEMGILSALWEATAADLVAVGIQSLVVMAILSIDLTGTTPWYPSTINSFGNVMNVELITERCTGKAQCVLVCPRNVFEMAGSARKVQIVRPDDCISCGACIVQCPEDALQFRFADGRIVDPATVRTTRVNMLGRRSLPIHNPD